MKNNKNDKSIFKKAETIENKNAANTKEQMQNHIEQQNEKQTKRKREKKTMK